VPLRDTPWLSHKRERVIGAVLREIVSLVYVPQRES